MNHISLMLKPASGLCNLRCRYCFYADEMKKRGTASFGLMSKETLGAVLGKACAAALDGDKGTGTLSIVFQGGEPTLAGLDFFRAASELCEQGRRSGLSISLALQTNGLALDDEWCAFLARGGFLVGLSLDGPAAIHNANRVDSRGEGSYDRVMSALRLLRKHGVETNVLSVVTAQSAGCAAELYAFFKKNRLRYQQYIPCLSPLVSADAAEAAGRPGAERWALGSEEYGRFLRDSFDLWYADALGPSPRFNRYFDNLLFIMNGDAPEECGMAGLCSVQYVVEADGSVYPCDFYMLDRYRLGNLVKDSFSDLDARRREIGFIEESARLAPECLRCRWFRLCRGGCRRYREAGAAAAVPEAGRSVLCMAYRSFFEYAVPRLEALLARLGR